VKAVSQSDFAQSDIWRKKFIGKMIMLANKNREGMFRGEFRNRRKQVMRVESCSAILIFEQERVDGNVHGCGYAIEVLLALGVAISRED
jgi:hypothetical protein